ncbi:sphingoid long chain base kinase-like protein [Cryomyces antarcticus]
MATSAADGVRDPFRDSSAEDREYGSSEGSTLNVGRNATLTLGVDSLIVLGSKATRAIPFYNILWANINDYSTASEIVINYAHPVSKSCIRTKSLAYAVDKADHRHAEAWTESLLDRAYGESQRRKRMKVLINPFGGKGQAKKYYDRDIAPIFTGAWCEVDVERTQYSGHAVEIAQQLDTDRYDVVACCSGDGLPHEVFNGLGRKRDARRALRKIAVVQLPCGTGNAMSQNLNGTDSPSLAALCIVKGLRTPLDLIAITQGDRRMLSFLSQSVGIVAETDLATEHLRWMGSQRFTYGFLIRLLGKTVYPCDVAVAVEIGDKAAIRDAYNAAVSSKAAPSSRSSSCSGGTTEGDDPADLGLPALKFGTVQDALPEGWKLVAHDKLGNFYAGNMAYMSAKANFFPAALPADGCADLVCIDGDISRRAAISSLGAVENGAFFDMPHVHYRKIKGYRILPKQPGDGYISIDGERVPFEPFQAEVLAALGTVLSRSGRGYEARGP